MRVVTSARAVSRAALSTAAPLPTGSTAIRAMTNRAAMPMASPGAALTPRSSDRAPLDEDGEADGAGVAAGGEGAGAASPMPLSIRVITASRAASASSPLATRVMGS